MEEGSLKEEVITWQLLENDPSFIIHQYFSYGQPAFSLNLRGTILSSKIYLRIGASKAESYLIKLPLKSNFKEILFYTSSPKNASL